MLTKEPIAQAIDGSLRPPDSLLLRRRESNGERSWIPAFAGMTNMLRINSELSIPERELHFTFSRSSGPGGQNVNKVSTRVTLSFDVAGSASLSDLQRGRISRALASRLTREGILRIDAGEERSQAANRVAAVERFVKLLASALRVKKARKRTRPSRSSVERRLTTKSKHSEQKRSRSRRFGDSD